MEIRYEFMVTASAGSIRVWLQGRSRSSQQDVGQDAGQDAELTIEANEEFFRLLAGLDQLAVVERVRMLAAAVERDPEKYRRDMLRIAGDDEIAVEICLRLLRAVSEGRHNRGDQRGKGWRRGDEQRREAKVIAFCQPGEDDRDRDA